ncbi:preprotein translocase subunit SecD [Bryocella elongata]|uniref:Protein translocase subunit SecD n=1 Tax=Bryocella elongata TaxID=863522 RepID=A0A1H5YDT8_9BACT|nr:protein translocase subunit SecD [Bryocella elongata]SEG22213.1 preprotein translocase subunit SecD [Bryocella elongata]
MGKNLGTRLAIIIGVLLVFAYGIVGIPHGGLKQSIADRIHLGLDLQGGIHLVLKVHVTEAVNAETDRDVQRLNTELATYTATATKPNAADAADSEKSSQQGFDVAKANMIQIAGGSANQQSDIRGVLNGQEYANYDVNSTGSGYTMVLKQQAIRDTESRTLDVSIETIRERIDKLGTLEPVVEKYGLGDDQILLELPGVFDPAKVEQIIETTPKLAIHEVIGNPYPDPTQALAAIGGVLPPDEEIVTGGNGMGGPDQSWVLKRASVVEGTDFRDAQPSTDENGRPDIRFSLTTDAGERFYKYTSSNVGNAMAVVLDNRVREVATINSAIRDDGQITGGFTQEQAESLSQALRSGSIPATITQIETRVVGPSLGSQSIHDGVMASVIGMLVVMVFMLVYYKGAGINADLALMLNLLILLGFMGYTHSTLTLPGIAGVILTIGMGVDSNVLIFERIREELRSGKNSAAALQDGFNHAWITIVDTHVTTVVSAGILFLFGTGPVKGFAVTLTLGLLANIFTAVFVSRTIFDWLLSKKERGAALSI